MDWPALIAKLERHLTHAQIARHVGRTESWVGQIKSGFIREPRYSVGEKLIALGAQYGVSGYAPGDGRDA
jgi:hypothetical protein